MSMKNQSTFSAQKQFDLICLFVYCCNFTFLQVQSDMFLNITMLTVWLGLGKETAFSG